jgi:hypothetical protein
MTRPPLLTFAEAETVGAQLHDHWTKMAGKAPMAREDMAWADLVQRVIRLARDVVDAREGGDDK